MINLSYKLFKDTNLNDIFFDSLKLDYKEFSEWFQKKQNEFAYVFENESGAIDGFLYVKIETEALFDISPPLPPKKRIKVGTFKINAHGTKLGERFIKKIFDHALDFHAEEIYVTAFENHAPLIAIFNKYGFEKVGVKNSQNGQESVYLKVMGAYSQNILHDYPAVNTNGVNIYTLALYPQWHTRLLPDSILNNESQEIVKDISHANSIHKVYLAGMKDVANFKRGDVILIYRTTDGFGPAHHRSVITSVCVMEEYRSIFSFKDYAEFLFYCKPYTVFTNQELALFWQQKKYPHIIRFTYNIALKKRVTRKTLIDECGVNANAYAGVMSLTKEQFLCILEKGQTDESFVIH